jgi:glycine C-acetyltransferase/8-amino-7-oxononanoate synthase
MTLHRRLEERLARFTGADAAVVFGSGALANLGVIPALARKGEVVFHDELAHASIVDGCRLAGADTFAYGHGDPEHLAWGLQQADGRGALIATDGVFSLDGDVAPLEDIVRLARRYDVRVLVDEAQALGAIGPGGRGAVAEAGLEDEVDVITGSLGKALGSYGGFACCDHVTARFLVNTARPLAHSTAPPPVAVAAAMAALELLEDQPRRVEKLVGNADALRAELAREGFDVAGASTHIVPLLVGEADTATQIVENALDQGVFCEAVLPPAAPDGAVRLRLAVMASHTRPELRGAARIRLAVMASHPRPELRGAARVLARAALRAGMRPGAGAPVAIAQFDEMPRAA